MFVNNIFYEITDKIVCVECAWCKTLFNTYLCRILKGRGRYCSKKCVGYFNGKRQKYILGKLNHIGRNNNNWSGGKDVPCDICGKLFWKYPSRTTPTCSAKCGYIRAQKVREGKLVAKNTRRKKYKGIDRWDILRNEVLKRDKFTCINCMGCFESNTSYLHVHHKVRLVDGGSNDYSNLETLCRKCHHDTHKKHRRNRYKYE